MPLGWIDFSKSDQAKALDVLSNLSEKGTLDELGVGPIRDCFSWYFFPGTSTIQTRAKYFFIVPYALIDLERGAETDPKTIEDHLDKTERECAEIFLEENKGKDEREVGIIGQDPNGKWVKRTPSNIYWAGLRQLGIFTGGDLSLPEYIRASCNMKKEKQMTRRQGRNRDTDRDPDIDDPDAGMTFHSTFWNIKTYDSGWKKKEKDKDGKETCRLHMKLTCAEAAFLRDQIVNSHSDAVRKSMMAYLLKEGRENELSAFLEAKTFDKVCTINFPDDIQRDYDLAMQFSKMYYIIAAAYNLVVSKDKQEDALKAWDQFLSNPEAYTAVDLNALFCRIPNCNLPLQKFLTDCKELLEHKKLDALKYRVTKREVALKGEARAKTRHPEEYALHKENSTEQPKYQWYGIKHLEYRFSTAKRILLDIKEGLDNDGLQ